MREVGVVEPIRIEGIANPVFPIALGTYHLLDKMNAYQAIEALEHAALAGINLLDTSDNYQTETVIGRALSAGALRRQKIIIATKTGLGTTAREQQAWQQEQRPANTDPARVRQQVEQSLFLLDVDYIDLYQLHAYDPQVPPEAHAELMAELLETGRIKAWGVSGYGAAELRALLQACDDQHLPRPVTSQPFYNLASTYQTDAVDLAHQEGLTVLAHSPLLKRGLTDRGLQLLNQDVHQRITAVPPDESVNTAHLEEVIDQLHSIAALARARNRNLAQVALAWLVQKPNTVVLTTPTNPDYLDQALQAAEWHLDQEIITAINQLRSDQAALTTFQNYAHALMRHLFF